MIKKLKNKKYFKTIMFFVYETIYLLFIEAFNQYLVTKSFYIGDYMIKNIVVFDIIWILLYFIILYTLNPKPRKIISSIINIILLLLSIANYFMYSYFQSVFSWKDLFLSGDGFSFINSILKFINVKLILFILVAVYIILLIIKTKTKKTFRINSFKNIIIIILLIIILVIRTIYIKNNLSNTSDGWNSGEVNGNMANYYINWIEPTKLIKICGTYEYLIKDFNNSFLKKNNTIEARKNFEKYIEENNKSKNDNK